MSDLQSIESRLNKHTGSILLLPDAHDPSSFEVAASGNFLNFTKTENPFGYINRPEMTGWKFHISIAPEDMQKAFEIIYEEAKKAELHYFKATNETLTQKWDDPNSSQRGKMFTIYDAGEPGFGNFLKEIEQKMREAGIKPSHNVLGDKAVSGSQYMSYRNDGNLNHEGYEAANKSAHLPEAERYNPKNFPDPFKDLAFSESQIIKNNSVLTNSVEKPVLNKIVPELTYAEWHIGRLPWVKATEAGSEFYRVDTGLLSKDLNNIYYALKGNGIEADLVKSNSDGRTYVQIADEKSMQRLNELQIKSTVLRQTPENAALYKISLSTLQQEPALSYAREQFGVSESYANESIVTNTLTDAYYKQGIEVNTTLSDGKKLFVLPESQTNELRVFPGTPVESVKAVSVEASLPEIKPPVMSAAIDDVKLVSLASNSATRAAVGAGFGVVAAAPFAYQTYQQAEEQVKQGNPVGAGTTVLNSAAVYVAGGVCGAGAAVAAAPLLTVPLLGEFAFGGAVLASALCSKAAKDFIETSQHFTDQIRQHALNNGLDPDKALEQLQNVSRQIPNQSLAVNQEQGYTR